MNFDKYKNILMVLQQIEKEMMRILSYMNENKIIQPDYLIKPLYNNSINVDEKKKGEIK